MLGILDFTPEGFPEELLLEYSFANMKFNHIYSDKVSVLMLQLNQLGNAEDEEYRDSLLLEYNL